MTAIQRLGVVLGVRSGQGAEVLDERGRIKTRMPGVVNFDLPRELSHE